MTRLRPLALVLAAVFCGACSTMAPDYRRPEQLSDGGVLVVARLRLVCNWPTRFSVRGGR